MTDHPILFSAPMVRALLEGANGDGTTRIQKLGKRRAGRTLDGVTHDAFPAVKHV